jgi:hypothetical protein
MLVTVEAERVCETMAEFDDSIDEWATEVANYAMMTIAGMSDRRSIGCNAESDCTYAAQMLGQVYSKALRVIEKEYLPDSCKNEYGRAISW